MDFTQIPSPCFVLEEDLLVKNLQLLDRVQQQANVEIIMAFKGFAMWSAFPIVKKYLAGATASSLHEARLCSEEMEVPAHIYAPAYLPEEFDELLDYAGHIVFNSLAQFHRYYPKVKLSGLDISCGLRVNIGYSPVETDLYNPCATGSRLGIMPSELANGLPEGIEGLHFHVLCESGAEHLKLALEAFEKYFSAHIPKLKWLNLGGGHLITRKGYNVELAVRTLKEFGQKHQIKLILEPGSAIAWETGVLRSRVLDIVENRGVRTAILDISFTAHMPDTLEMPYRPRIVGAKEPDAASKHLYRLGGISCLAGDFMEVYDFGRELQIGDPVVFEDMIHYTMVKTNTFNGVKHPAIGIWSLDDEFELVREFGYGDFKNRLS